MLNKNKILIITAMGIIANLPSANAQTQTFYQCMPCPAGTYGSNGKCTPCPAGTYSQVSGATSSSVCTPCAVGTYSNAGSISCTPCPKGTYGNNIGLASCTPCEDGYFAPTERMTHCYSCPSIKIIYDYPYRDIHKIFNSYDGNITCEPRSFDSYYTTIKKNSKGCKVDRDSFHSEDNLFVASPDKTFKISCDKVTGNTYAEGDLGKVYKDKE